MEASNVAGGARSYRSSKTKPRSSQTESDIEEIEPDLGHIQQDQDKRAVDGG